MEYLKLFAQHSEYEEFINGGGGGVELPNVSYCEKENVVHYNPIVTQQNNEIWYTSTDGNIVTPYSGSTTPFLDTDGNNIPIVSNTYENGKGIIKLEKDCYQIETSAFNSCTSLLGIIIPNSITTIGVSAFSNCNSLKNITIPDSVTSIGTSAFMFCSSLIEITIPDSVTYIGASVFTYCSSLIEITIPDSVTYIGANVFIYSSKLSSIIVLPTTPPTLGNNAFNNIASNVVIYVPSNSVDAYKSAKNWSTYADKIQPITN